MTQIQIHQHERTPEGTNYVQTNRVKLSTNCKKLLSFWQAKRYWLNKHDCLKFVGVDCLTQRVYDLARKNNIPIDKHTEPGDDCTRYRLKCTCHHIGGELHKTGCWAHDPQLKITTP